MPERRLSKDFVRYYFSQMEYKIGLPGYETVKGYANSKKVDQGTETANIDFKGNNSIGIQMCEASAQAIGVSLYDVSKKKVRLGDIVEMQTGRTYPLRVNMRVGDMPKTVYVKKPSMLRALGAELYNICSHHELVFGFNEGIFVSEQVPGKLAVKLSDKEKQELVADTPYLENLVRLDTVARMFFLTDLEKPHNYSVDKEGNVYHFDFDESFVEGYHGVINPTEQVHMNGMTSTADIIHDEKIKIAARLAKNKEKVSALIAFLKRENILEFESRKKCVEENIGEKLERRVESLMAA